MAGVNLKRRRIAQHAAQWSLAMDVIHKGMEMMPITCSKATQDAYSRLLESALRDIEADEKALLGHREAH